MLLRPYPHPHEKAHGSLRRYAHHPRCQRIPLPDRDGASAGGLRPQLPHRGGSREQQRHPGRLRGAFRGAVLGYRQGRHRRREVLGQRHEDHAGHQPRRPSGGPQDHRPFRGQGRPREGQEKAA